MNVTTTGLRRTVSAALCMVGVMTAGCAGQNRALATNQNLQKASASWKELAAMDMRLLRISDRLTRASAPLCDGAGTFGLSLSRLADIPVSQHSAVEAVYGIGVSDVFVTAVAEGSVAEEAGIRVGDGIAAIGPYSMAGLTMDQIWSVLGTVREGTDYLIVRDRSGKRAIVSVGATRACNTAFVVEPDAKLSASSDGSRVRITSGLIRFSQSDGELAAVLAHELAHSILCHRRRDKNLAKREEGADQLSVYLLMAADYEIDSAINFWQRFGKYRGLTDLFDIGHGRAAIRIARLKDEVVRIGGVPELAMIERTSALSSCEP